jgi:multicomponent Na+:H+ antiporter subunit B
VSTDTGTGPSPEVDVDPDAEADATEPIIADPYDRRTTVVARTTVRVVVPIILVTSIALLLQGHNLPGGGFIGGVLTAIAITLLYVVYGLDYVRERLVPESGDGERARHPSRLLLSAGLALAVLSGLGPVVLGGSFLSQGYVVFPEPLPGPFFHEFEIATALAFDLGVYLVVVGGLLTIVREVGEE